MSREEAEFLFQVEFPKENKINYIEVKSLTLDFETLRELLLQTRNNVNFAIDHQSHLTSTEYLELI